MLQPLMSFTCRIAWLGKHSSYLLAILFFVSCGTKNDPECAAQQLLSQARTALKQRDLSLADSLLDSLRHTYPHAVQTRYEALSFADTLRLAQARVEAARAEIDYAEANDAFTRFNAQHPNVSPIDPEYQRQRDRVDTLRMLLDRKQMKVKFYVRKIQTDTLHTAP